MPSIRVALSHCMVALTVLLAAGAAQADEVLSPLVATPIASPNPVLGADAKMHLAYEIVLLNLAPAALTLTRIETLDAETGTLLGTLAGEGLEAMSKLNGGTGSAATLPGGGSGIVFMDVMLAPDAAMPKALKHRFSLKVAPGGGGPDANDPDPVPDSGVEIVITGDALPVEDRPALVLAPPLKGARWAIGGGCCTPISYHRGATLPINGLIRVAERFAIDFVQLNEKNMLNTGPQDELSSYVFHGDEIYAAAAGTVVAAKDGLPEQVPGKLPEDATMEMAPGNHVVVDMGEGRYAFYAHMRPGSVRVKVGDTVKTGDVIGLLGNSGNTDSPHLHFHIMDGPSPLLANGLPFVFTAFTGQGRITDEQPLFTGGTVDIDKEGLAGPHQKEMPLHDQVVSFP